MLKIQKGDTIKIKSQGTTAEGTVLSADYYGERDGWYIELEAPYRYWKQGFDGGYVVEVNGQQVAREDVKRPAPPPRKYPAEYTPYNSAVTEEYQAKWSTYPNHWPVASSLADMVAAEIGFTRDFIAAEFSGGDYVTHGFVNASLSLYIRVNTTNGQVEVKEVGA